MESASTPLYSLDKLKEIDDSEDFINQVIGIFLETVPPTSQMLVKACSDEDWQQVYFYAHKMKANVNLLSISSIIDEIKFVESGAKGLVHLEEMQQKVEHINEVVSRAAEEMRGSVKRIDL